MKTLLSITLAGMLMLTGCSDQGGTGQQKTDDTNPTEENQNQNENADKKQGDSSDQTDNKEGKSSDQTDSKEGQNDGGNNNTGNNDNSDEQQSNENGSNQDEKASDEFDKGRAKTVLKEYETAFKKVVSYTNDNGKQKEFSTKQELKVHFLHFMSNERAQTMVDTYFEQKEDGLYVKAMDGPTFLKTDQPFTFTKNKNGTVTVTQERENQLIGHVKMEYTLIKKEGYWIVKSVKSHKLE